MMNKLDMSSRDIVNANIENIGRLFPNCIIEGKIDFNALKQELTNDIIDSSKEKYQLTWSGKNEAKVEANRPINKTLRLVKEKSVDFDKTKNIYIEGDNLEVLKILQESYLNKIKCIYIDPPYNTGNDFIYNDDFGNEIKEELKNTEQMDEYDNKLISNSDSNGRFHSDWLSMIYPRLKLARNLLKQDGIIFISIDDNELENLKKICNEIFGEKNFCGQYMWYKSATPPNLSYKIKKNLEYVLCYQKNRNNIKFQGVKKESKSTDPIIKPQNTMKKLVFPPYTLIYKGNDEIIKSGVYGTEKYPNKLNNDLIIENGTNKNSVEFENRFIWTQETLDSNIYNNTKFYLSDSLVISYKKANYDPEVPPNLIDDNVGVGTTEEAGKKLEELFGIRNIFSYPKDVNLIKYLLNFEKEDEEIVLDFFSGSATTAHAVMQLNAEDGGHRRYIMVQIPEICDEKTDIYTNGYNDICDIGEERIRRAGKKIKEETNANIDYGFRVYRVDSSNMKDVYYEPSKLNQAQLNMFESNIKEDRTSEDLLTQVILDLGLTLDLSIEEKNILNNKVYFVARNSLVACFDSQINIDILNEICDVKPLKVVFRESSFRNDSDKINAYERIKKLSPETEISVI